MQQPTHAKIIAAINECNYTYKEFGDEYKKTTGNALTDPAIGMWKTRGKIPSSHYPGYIATAKELKIKVKVNGRKRMITEFMLRNAKTGSA